MSAKLGRCLECGSTWSRCTLIWPARKCCVGCRHEWITVTVTRTRWTWWASWWSWLVIGALGWWLVSR